MTEPLSEEYHRLHIVHHRAEASQLPEDYLMANEHLHKHQGQETILCPVVDLVPVAAVAVELMKCLAVVLMLLVLMIRVFEVRFALDEHPLG